MSTPPPDHHEALEQAATSRATPGRRIDVRGPRFSAALTATVLAASFLLQSSTLLAVQVVVFAVGALAGPRWSPYGALFRLLKRQLDLGPAPATEGVSGPRFSQLLGLVVSSAGLVAVTMGAADVGWGLVLVVVALSGLLATTGVCVGCEFYALGQRLSRRAAADLP